MPTIAGITAKQRVLASVQAWPHWNEIGLAAAKEYRMSQEKDQLYLPALQKFLTLVSIGHHGLEMFNAHVNNIWHSLILIMYNQKSSLVETLASGDTDWVSILGGEMRQRGKEKETKSSSFVELGKKQNIQVRRRISYAGTAYHTNGDTPK